MHESRMYVMMHLAIHDSLNAIQPRFAPYTFHGRGTGADLEAAVSSASRTVLISVLRDLQESVPTGCIERSVELVESSYAAALDDMPNRSAKVRGIAVGRSAAFEILSDRVLDGSERLKASHSTRTGSAGGSDASDYPWKQWSQVTPFMPAASNDLRPKPPDHSSPEYTEDFNEIQALGGDGFLTETTRTPQQSATALFWRQSPPLTWNAIARTVARTRQLDIFDSARLFGLLNLAMADGYITAAVIAESPASAWAAVRAGEGDRNESTDGDHRWTPLTGTDPLTDHESAHALQSAAAATVLAGVLETDNVAIAVCSATALSGHRCKDKDPEYRYYDSFSHAATETGSAQVLSGRQFSFAVKASMLRGTQVGVQALDRSLSLNTPALAQHCYPPPPGGSSDHC